MKFNYILTIVILLFFALPNLAQQKHISPSFSQQPFLKKLSKDFQKKSTPRPAPTLRYFALFAAPSINNFLATGSIAENTSNANPTFMDQTVTFNDGGGTPTYTSLTLTYTSGGGVEDQLSVHNEGTGTGEIGVAGTTISFGGTDFGTITSNGTNGANLTISLNGSTTEAAVERLLENLQYQNISNIPALTRTVQISLINSNGTANHSIIITVNAENDLPSGGNGSVTTNEDVNYTFQVSDFIFSDPDGDSFAGIRIESVETNGDLEYNGIDVAVNTLCPNVTLLVFKPTPNANGSPYATFTFRVRDGVGLSTATYSMTINVTATPDNPTGADVSVNTNEDVNKTFALGDFVFADVDGDSFGGIEIASLETVGDLEYNGVDVAIGTICADVSLLVFKPVANANGSPYATFTFRVRDSGGGTSTATYTMTINVTPVNDLPTGGDATVNTNEDVNYTFQASDFPFNDVDGTFNGIQIASLETAGDLEYNGIDVAVGTNCPNVTLLVFKPALNATGSPYATFTFRVRDNNNAQSAATYTMTINVVDVNDAPDLANTTAGGLAYSEGQTPVVISPTGLGITDTDNPNMVSATIAINTNYQNGTDVLALTPLPAGISSASFNNTNGILTILGNGTNAQFTAALQQVTFANTGDNPTATGATRQITFQVNDGTSNSNIVARTITITPINDPPIITEGTSTNVSMTEDATPTPFSLTLNATDPDNTGAQLNWTVSSPASNGVATVTGTGFSKVINYTPNANFNGIDVFTVRVSDGSLNDEITVNVTVSAVNDEPIANAQTVNALENTELLITLTGNDGDPDVAQNLSYVLVSLPTTGTLSLTSNGTAIAPGSLPLTLAGNTIFFRPANNDVNTRTFQFRVQDDGGTANGGDNTSQNATITINVTIINDQPIANPQTVNTLENTQAMITLTGDDGDVNANQSLTYIITELPTRGTLSQTAGGAALATVPFTLSSANVFYTPETGNNGSQGFRFRVKDNGGTANGGIDESTPALVTINIAAVNDPPTLDVISDQPATTKNAIPNIKNINLTGIGSGANDEFQILTVTATSSNTALIPHPSIQYISPNSTATLTYEVIGTVSNNTNVTITVTVQDNGGTANGGNDTFVRTFIIPIIPLPDPPSNFSATPFNLNQVNLSWSNVSGNEGYEIWRSKDSNGAFSLLTSPTFPANPSPNTGVNQTFYPDATLATEDIFYYKIRTVKNTGNSEFSPEIVATTILRKPIQVFVEGVSSSSIKISWANTSSIATGFRIQRSTSADFTTNLATIQIDNATTSSYEDINLNEETRYFYRIKAINNVLDPFVIFESDYSEIGDDFTLLKSPTVFEIISDDPTFNKIKWQSTSTLTQSFVIERTTIPNSFDPSVIGYKIFIEPFSGTSYEIRDFDIDLETRYFYRIIAVSPQTNSANSATVSVFTFLRRPTNLEVNPITTTRNSLTWQNNSVFAIGYEIQRSSGGAFAQIRINSGANNTNFIDTDVLPNTVYFYRVRTLGQEANSDFSEAVTVSIFPPSELSATTVSASSIELSWINNATNIIGNIIERSEINQNEGFAIVATVDPTFVNYLDVNLLEGKQYFYRLRGYNATDTSASSNVASAIAADVPASPTDLILNVISSSQINLIWNDNANNETEFRIERANILANNGAFDEIAIVSSSGTGIGKFNFADTGLQPNQTYRYRVRASNANGNSRYTNIAEATTLTTGTELPNPPTNLIAESVSDDQINLRWTNNAENAVIFKIDRSISPNGPFTQIGEVPASTTRFASTGLLKVPSPGNAYFYRVKASNQAGDSVPSDTVSAIAVCNVVIISVSDAIDGSICIGKAASLRLTTNAVGATYQWRRNGANIAGATLPNFTASEDGIYTCQVRAGSCILTSNELGIVVRDAFEVQINLNNQGVLVSSVADGSEYQWYRNFQPIEGANQDTYTPTESGSYSVTVTKSGCSASSNVYVFQVTALESFNFSSAILIFPNPSRSYFQVELETTINGEYEIALIDFAGRRYSLDKGRKESFKLQKTLDISHFPAGIYMLEIKSGKYRGWKKMIKE